MTDTDAVLLHRWARERDAEAFRDLVDRYARMVHAVARRILPSPDQAEDVSQECFLKLANGPDAPERSLSTWLHRVATNLAISRLRADRRRRRAEARPLPRTGSDEGAWHEIENAVDEAIAALPDAQRVPVVESFLAGRTHESIAADLGVARETVTSRVRAGIQSIRRTLEQRGIRATAQVLTAGLLGSQSASAAGLPAGLSVALGRIALAGPRVRAASASVTGSLGILMKTTLVAVALALVGGGIALFGGDAAGPDAAPAQAAAETQTAVLDPVTPPASASVIAERQDSRRQPVAARELRGKVVDDQGRAVARATVSIAWPPPGYDASDILNDRTLAPEHWSRARLRQSLSEADGTFVFRGVPPAGNATVAVFHDGSFQNCATWKLDDPDSERVLQLGKGMTLRGSLVSVRGAPVVDAIVRVYYAHDATGYTGYPGFAATDPTGRFELALDPTTQHVTLRVCSDTHGQQFFMAVPTDGEAELRYLPSGSIRGAIRWDGDKPATGVEVCVDAEVPEPKMSTMYTGWRRRVQMTAAVGADGTYHIDGLYPGFTYDVFVIDPTVEVRQRFLKPLSPRWKNRFNVVPGETHTWDTSLSRPIVITGRVLTESTRRAVPRINICLKKDGAKLNLVHFETDAEGRYEVSLNTGPGTYDIVATPQNGFDAVSELIYSRFGHQLVLAAGDERALDLTVHEPSVLPIRVVDADGKPVRSIRYKISHKLANGRRTGFGSSCRLDDQGRYRFEIFHPVAETSLEVHAFPGGPPVDAGVFRPELGTELLETEIRLPATCDVIGTIVSETGEPLAKARLTIRALFEDGKNETFYANTDENGRFAQKARLRVAPVVLEISARRENVSWRSEMLQPSKSEAVQLGRVVAR